MKKYIFLIIALIVLGGCTKELAEPVEEEIVETGEAQPIIEENLSREKQTAVLKDYYGKLSSNSKKEEILNLVDENAPKLDEDIMDEIVLSLEDHLILTNPSIKVLSETLTKYKDYSSDEVKSYLDILNTEGQMIFTDGESMIVSLDELIKRGINAENHLIRYPEGKTVNKVRGFYSAYIYAAIQGAGNQYIYGEESSSKISEDVLNQYRDLIESNPDFNMSKVFLEYLDTLALDEYDLNGENVIKFYEDLQGIIKDNTKF